MRGSRRGCGLHRCPTGTRASAPSSLRCVRSAVNLRGGVNPQPDKPRPLVRPFLRWTGVIVFGGAGLSWLLPDLVRLVGNPRPDSTDYLLFLLVSLLLALPLLL